MGSLTFGRDSSVASGNTSGSASVSDLAWAALVALLLLAISAAFVSAELGFIHKAKRVAETDHLRYIEMARGKAGHAELAREAPFCFRILVPFMAGRLAEAGLSLNAAFYLVTNLSLFAFLVVLFVYLRELGFGRGASLLGIALVGLMQGAVRWYEYQYWMTDPTCLCLVTWSLLLIRRGRIRSAAAVVSLNALVRETSLIVLPYAFFRFLRLGSFRDALRRTSALALAPVAITVGIHLLIRPIQQPSPIAVLADSLSFRSRHLLDNQLYLLTFGTFGALLPLALLSPRRAKRLLLAEPEDLALILSCYLSLAVANNTERLLAYCVPAVVRLALESLETAGKAGLRWGAAALFALALQALFWQQTRLFGAGMSVYQPTNFTVVAAMCLSWALAATLSGTRDGQTAP